MHAAWANVPQHLRQEAYRIFTTLPQYGSSDIESCWRRYTDPQGETAACCPFGALNIALVGGTIADLPAFLEGHLRTLVPTDPNLLVAHQDIDFTTYQRFIIDWDTGRIPDLAEAMGVTLDDEGIDTADYERFWNEMEEASDAGRVIELEAATETPTSDLQGFFDTVTPGVNAEIWGKRVKKVRMILTYDVEE